VSEVQYFEGLRNYCKNPLVTLHVQGAAGVPLTLVERARSLRDQAAAEARRAKDSFLLYDEVWCVFDVDNPHPKIPEARVTATDNGLRLGMSNPCFELWLLLHLRDHPGPRHRHDVQSMLRRLMPGVPEKHVDLAVILPGYEHAISRARRLEVEALEADEPCRNPTTEVFHLANSIDEAGRQRRAAQLRRRNDASRAKAAAAAEAALTLAHAQAERDSEE
jgi:hypothetical protein